MSKDAPPLVTADRYVLFGALAVLGCGLDLATKHWVFCQPGLEAGAVWWGLDDLAGVQRSLNEGALFGMGQGGALWFAGLSLLAALAIPFWLFGLRVASDRWMTFSLGLVMGGVLGNLYDRLGLPGLVWGRDWPAEADRVGQPIYAVRDWILLQWNDQLRWPNFNIADSLLVTGAVLLVLRASWPPTASEQPMGEPSTGEPSISEPGASADS